jgi:PHD/YefM family antitoxin component YafN of YafNO toxin-antitoxin module
MPTVEAIMKKQEFQPNEVIELLTPLIDFTKMKSCSVSSLKNNPESIAEKIETGGKPIALTHSGKIIALLCNPSVYQKTEERRRHLVALLEDAPREFIPTVGRRSMLPSEHQNIQELKQCIARIERLEDSINSTKCSLYSLEEELHEITEKKLKLIPKIKPVLLATK